MKGSAPARLIWIYMLKLPKTPARTVPAASPFTLHNVMRAIVGCKGSNPKPQTIPKKGD